MKREYMSPEIIVIIMETEGLLASSTIEKKVDNIENNNIMGD